jgi:cytoskeletal protein RodZ
VDISKYIHSYLIEYNTSVIVPDLGCFSIAHVPSKIKDGVVVPPTKTVTFDSEKSDDDKVFTLYIAKKEDITPEQASKEIKNFYRYFFINKLVKERRPIVFEKFGTFSIDISGNMHFEPIADFFKDTFGLGSAQIPTKPIAAPPAPVTPKPAMPTPVPVVPKPAMPTPIPTPAPIRPVTPVQINVQQQGNVVEDDFNHPVFELLKNPTTKQAPTVVPKPVAPIMPAPPKPIVPISQPVVPTRPVTPIVQPVVPTTPKPQPQQPINQPIPTPQVAQPIVEKRVIKETPSVSDTNIIDFENKQLRENTTRKLPTVERKEAPKQQAPKQQKMQPKAAKKPERAKKSGSFGKYIAILLILIILGVGGYFAYPYALPYIDKYLNKEESAKVEHVEEKNDVEDHDDFDDDEDDGGRSALNPDDQPQQTTQQQTTQPVQQQQQQQQTTQPAQQQQQPVSYGGGGTGNFIIVVASLPTQELAEAEVRELRRTSGGHNFEIISYRGNFRISAGRYATEAEAESQKQQILGMRWSRSDIWVWIRR